MSADNKIAEEYTLLMGFFSPRLMRKLHKTIETEKTLTYNK